MNDAAVEAGFNVGDEITLGVPVDPESYFTGAESEMAAASVTERMSLPSVLLVLGFLIFLCYPALIAMLQITG